MPDIDTTGALPHIETANAMSEFETIRPKWAVSKRLVVHCTTRVGGLSNAPYTSLNLGLHVRDDAQTVHRNRQRLMQQLTLPAEPVWLQQVHGTRVLTLPAAVPSGSPLCEPLEADGAWTARPGLVLAVLTADCLPVVISDAQGSGFAVVHAGWRGLVSGVLDAALAQFPPESMLHAWLGPAIGPGRFEVGPEVRLAYVKRDKQHTHAFAAVPDSDRFLADIYRLADRELNRSRVVTITGGEHCTVGDATRFYSYRRDGAESGRMATIAWIKEQTGPPAC